MAKKSQALRVLTPLGIIAAFLSLTEVVAGIAASKTTGYVQAGLTIFVCIFPVLVAGGFFGILWTKSHVFYPPAEFGSQQDVRAYVEAMQGRREALSSTAEVQEKKTEPEAREIVSTELRTEKEQAASEEALATPPSKAPSTAEEFKMGMIISFIEERFEDAEQNFSKLIEIEKDDAKRAGHEVSHAYLRYTYAEDLNAFNELVRLSALPNTESEASFYLGLSYERLKDFDKAVEALQKSVDTAPADVKPHRFVSLAQAIAANGKPEQAVATLVDSLANFPDRKEQVILYEGLAGIFEKTGDQEMRALSLELALEGKPQDTELRFSAAWSYSKHGFRDMSLLHYSAEVSAKSDASALNNLGVAYENFGLPINAVRNYRRAFEDKNTLAAANLAYQFLEAGFYSDAKDILDKAKVMQDLHPNVGSAIAALSEREEKEAATKKEILARAQQEQKFIKDYARRYFAKASDYFSGQWKSIDGGVIALAKDDRAVSATWVHEKKKHQMSGLVTNRTAKITLKSNPEDEILGFLSVTERSGYAYTSDDGQQMFWLLFEKQLPVFMSFSRVSPLS